MSWRKVVVNAKDLAVGPGMYPVIHWALPGKPLIYLGVDNSAMCVRETLRKIILLLGPPC